VIRNTGDGREMTLMRWGMLPPSRLPRAQVVTKLVLEPDAGDISQKAQEALCADIVRVLRTLSPLP